MALVRYFGYPVVRMALDELADGDNRGTETSSATPTRAKVGAARSAPGLPRAISALQKVDSERYAILSAFFQRVQAGELLREVDDVRRFADVVGSKGVEGTTRRELLVQLATALARVQVERLPHLLSKAAEISAQERSEGYSVLTDRLLRQD